MTNLVMIPAFGCDERLYAEIAPLLPSNVLSSTVVADGADMASMLANGTLEGVILHEMGHVLGIGGLWDNNDLVDPLNDTHYTGQYALSAWRTVSGNASASYVPLETAGGLGTAGVHWSETTLGDELMTGYVDNHMPISIVTIGTLADLGYTVNYTQADSYALA